MAGPVEDRLRLLRATHTHLSAVYGTVAGPSAALQDLLDRATAGPADAELTDEQGVVHTALGDPRGRAESAIGSARSPSSSRTDTIGTRPRSPTATSCAPTPGPARGTAS